MIYEKLPVVLLSTIASEPEASTNRHIARMILSSPDTKNMGIAELAEYCHVGTGSISRFCKEIGLEGYAELRKLLRESDYRYQKTDDIGEWLTKVKEAEETAAATADIAKIQQLCKDIESCQNIYAAGLLKAQNAVTDLQVDLLMMGKQIHTSVSYKEQTEHILSAGKDELIIIFSYTGSYFEYPSFRAKEKHLLLPKIWMITGSDRELPWYVDDKIVFSSDLDQTSHPYQLEIIADMIASVYHSRMF